MARATDLSTQAGRITYTRLFALAKKGLVTTYDLLKNIAAFLINNGNTNGKRIGEIAMEYLEKQSGKIENAPVSEETKQHLGAICSKYKIACSFETDTAKTPPQHYVFIQGKDAKILTKALAEVAAKILTQEKEKDQDQNQDKDQGKNNKNIAKNIVEDLQEMDKRSKNKVQDKERINNRGAMSK